MNLTKREMEVLAYICEGYTTPEIAKKLFVTTFTVKAHTASILRKLGVKNRTQAVRVATLQQLA